MNMKYKRIAPTNQQEYSCLEFKLTFKNGQRSPVGQAKGKGGHIHALCSQPAHNPARHQTFLCIAGTRPDKPNQFYWFRCERASSNDARHMYARDRTTSTSDSVQSLVGSFCKNMTMSYTMHMCIRPLNCSFTAAGQKPQPLQGF